jgi:hypothetical protein
MNLLRQIKDQTKFEFIWFIMIITFSNLNEIDLWLMNACVVNEYVPSQTVNYNENTVPI